MCNIKLLLVICTLLPGFAAANTQVKLDKFLGTIFKESSYKHSTLWVTQEIGDSLRVALGYKYPKLKLEYWHNRSTSVWVFDVIGKELPITAALAITSNSIAEIKILQYRESRGGEVVQQSFLQQFKGAQLNNGLLTNSIDGISGATLSVWAVKKMAYSALSAARFIPQATQKELDSKMD